VVDQILSSAPQWSRSRYGYHSIHQGLLNMNSTSNVCGNEQNQTNCECKIHCEGKTTILLEEENKNKA